MLLAITGKQKCGQMPRSWVFVFIAAISLLVGGASAE
jgi:hypothetical protein